MTSKKITDLTSLPNVDSTDLIAVVDVSASETKKATLSDTISSLNGIIATVSGSTFSQITGSLQKTSSGLSYIVGGANVSIISQSNGQIFVSSFGPGDAAAQYLLLSATASLSGERVFTPGTGLLGTDAGAGATYTLNANNNVLATISGSRFTGPVNAAGGLSGSLQRLSTGETYLVAVGGIAITTGTNGQVFISGSSVTGGGPGAPADAQYLTLATNSTLTVERVFTPSTGLFATDGGAGANYTLTIDNNVVSTISGSRFTGVVTAAGGLSASLQRLTTGETFLAGVGGITITTGTNGQVLVSGSNTALLAPLNAQYLTLATDPTLTVERVFTPSTGLRATDGGAGSTYTLTVNDGIVATLTGSRFTGPVQFTSTPIAALPTDNTVFFSGSAGLTGSNGTRRSVTFGGDLMLSGVIQENRPILAPKTRFWQYTSQSITTSATAFPAVFIPIPSGSMSIDALVTATTANVADVATFRKLTLFKNQAGAYSQIDAIGGVSAGFVTSSNASSWGMAMDILGTNARLVLTGSTSTITWAWNLFITEVTP